MLDVLALLALTVALTPVVWALRRFARGAAWSSAHACARGSAG